MAQCWLIYPLASLFLVGWARWRKTCTFYMRVSGNGLREHGIHGGDLMVIDRSVEPRSGNVVVVAYQGSFLLRPEEEAIPLDLERFDRSGLFGVVVHAVHHLNKNQLRKI